jgi:undecaprenyl phosphate N,N'-diacetylbacillosamine 1-phosphate transferase
MEGWRHACRAPGTRGFFGVTSARGRHLALKRAFDVLGAALGLVFALPVCFVVGALILMEDGPPIFYTQARIGKDGRRFTVLKFRSMQVNDLPTETPDEVTESHPLVTRTGRFLRRLKLDELPQLLNVLRGDMSLVGPRPALPGQVERYHPFQRRRLGMRPGMTGWAQVNGGIRLSWDERIVLDVWYLDHWSLKLDALVLSKTLRVVLFGERPNRQALQHAEAYANDTGRSP